MVLLYLFGTGFKVMLELVLRPYKSVNTVRPLREIKIKLWEYFLAELSKQWHGEKKAKFIYIQIYSTLIFIVDR